MPQPRSYRSYLNKSILNAAKVLRVLQRSIHPISTTDTANAADIARDQAYRCLITLEHEGMVDSVPAKSTTAGDLWCLADGVSLPHRRKT
ncbi:MAG: helix-turn-helix domain-containing protein [Gemmatimonadota bacterium]|nr:helix-turn-helix domain-containing protein [Gemmatimonadota bacterium]